MASAISQKKVSGSSVFVREPSGRTSFGFMIGECCKNACDEVKSNFAS